MSRVDVQMMQGRTKKQNIPDRRPLLLQMSASTLTLHGNCDETSTALASGSRSLRTATLCQASPSQNNAQLSFVSLRPYTRSAAALCIYRSVPHVQCFGDLSVQTVPCCTADTAVPCLFLCNCYSSSLLLSLVYIKIRSPTNRCDFTKNISRIIVISKANDANRPKWWQ